MDESAPPENASIKQSQVAAAENTRKLFSGLRVVSLLTLLSRILGMVRDIGMATLFGNGPIMDSWEKARFRPLFCLLLSGNWKIRAANLRGSWSPLFYSG